MDKKILFFLEKKIHLKKRNLTLRLLSLIKYSNLLLKETRCGETFQVVVINLILLFIYIKVSHALTFLVLILFRTSGHSLKLYKLPRMYMSFFIVKSLNF